MVDIKLRRLKITRSHTGAYYVYRRSNGEALIRNFKGTKAALLKRMEGPDFVRAYNAPRTIQRADAKDMAGDTLGGLVKAEGGGPAFAHGRSVDATGGEGSGAQWVAWRGASDA